ncbi:hypothetical protein A1O7_02050 [Cladophialophora yegresii CBS 114405]|uniref:Uncharacterized protein n=1 Tax=Cladophialophora yegresii CBS 114405 TaxID=1182544 RepID=W9WAR0_9EURO|nr:uncharacterized protein A1O7_02050 [Cladophialophora yegresii CBS 114405]EXJ61621.1 hypothetical protein A1O7_02050 [Cladophialophora yegresii CBS 114405]
MSRSPYDGPTSRQKHSHHGYRTSSSPITATKISMARSKSHADSQPSFFIEDRKGDMQILSYGTLNRNSIPRYRAAGRGRLLGLDAKYRITSRTETSLRVEDAESDSTRKSRKETLLAKLRDDDPAVTIIHHELSTRSDLEQDFLALETDRRPKRRRLETDPLRVAAGATESEESESDVDEAPVAEDPFESFKQNPIHQRHLELSKATEERPEAASTWLAMIEFQKDLLDNTIGKSPSPRDLSERKIALYEQALLHVKAQDDRHTLIIGLMREGRTVWDIDKQASRWKAFLGDGASFDLWKLYVDFVQTNSIKFSVEDCLQTHINWLKTFRVPRSGTTDRQRDSNCVFILIRLTLLLWQAGFTERAAGTWQALLEWNCFQPRPQPQHLQSTDSMSRFRDFWDSEVARIGEEGSKGWVTDTAFELDPITDRAFHIENMDVQQWFAAETELEKTSSLPARFLDEVGEDDSYRIVLFSEIQDLLFRPSSKSGLGLLVDGFLLFAGLPPVTSLDDSRTWKGDPFICNQSPSGPTTAELVEKGGHEIGICVQYQEVSFTVKQHTCQTPQNLGYRSGRLLDSSPEFLRRVIGQLADLAYEGQLPAGIMEYAVAFDAGIDLKVAKKQAKSFLKDKGDSLTLYDAYAFLEAQLGNFESAQKVWSTALSMRTSLTGDGHMHAFYMWRNWAYLHMCRGQFAQARTLLSMMTTQGFELARFKAESLNIQASSPAVQLKVEQHIKRQIDIAGLKGEHVSLRAMVDLLAYHRYLGNGLRLEVALDTYQACLKPYTGVSKSQSALIEGIHEQQARFIHAHAVIFRREFRPRVVSAILAPSARTFPDNLALLILNSHFSQKAGAMDRLRQVDSVARSQQDANTTGSVVPCMFDVLVELNRPAYSGSTDHSIRSAFKRATRVGSPGHGSVEMWKAFVLWETSLILRHDGSNRSSTGSHGLVSKEDLATLASQAREALYASLRACPWSKELCMLAFAHPTLRNALGDGALKQVYQTMVDRGMRLRVDISCVLQ